MPGFDLASAIKGAIQGAGSTIGGLIDSLNAPKEMKEQLKGAVDKQHLDLQSKMLEIGEAHEEAIIADTKNARETNSQIQQAEKSSWLAKNIPYIIAIFIMLIWGGCTVFIIGRTLNIIAKDPEVHMDTVMAMYAGITAIATIVINFYFGSTHSSKDKDATIATMAANQN